MPGAVNRPSPTPRPAVMSGAISSSGLGAGIASLYRQLLPAVAKYQDTKILLWPV